MHIRSLWSERTTPARPQPEDKLTKSLTELAEICLTHLLRSCSCRSLVDLQPQQSRRKLLQKFFLLRLHLLGQRFVVLVGGRERVLFVEGYNLSHDLLELYARQPPLLFHVHRFLIDLLLSLANGGSWLGRCLLLVPMPSVLSVTAHILF